MRCQRRAARVKSAFVCLLLLFFAVMARAQRITGVAYDPAGGTVAGARVMLMQDYVKLSETKSDAAGCFAFDPLKPGQYEIQIKQAKFSLWQETVEVKADDDPPVYAILPLLRGSERIGITVQVRAAIEKHKPEGKAKPGGQVDPPQLLKQPRVAYPSTVLERGIEGDVVLWATIKADGSVGNIRVITSPDPELEKDAVASTRQFQYVPMKLNGQPVEWQNKIVLSYHIK